MKPSDSNIQSNSNQTIPSGSLDLPAHQEIHQLIYVSFAVRDFDQEDLKSILETSRKHNALHDITGLLLCSNRNIVQILEGSKEAVRDLFDRIRVDPRHHKVTLLSFEKVNEREFERWTMGFKRVDPERFEHDLPDFTDIVERKNLNFELLSGLSIRVGFVLKRFSQMNRLDDLKSTG